MWIGLHKYHDDAIRYDDCSLYSAEDYNPTNNLDKGCVVFDATNETFLGNDCLESKPFLCQHTAYSKNVSVLWLYVWLVSSHEKIICKCGNYLSRN